MIPKLIDVIMKVSGFTFTPYSKWHIVFQFCHVIEKFIFHKTEKIGVPIIDEIGNAANQELFTLYMLGLCAIVLMHFGHGYKMRRNGIQPMHSNVTWFTWLRRIALLTRH